MLRRRVVVGLVCVLSMVSVVTPAWAHNGDGDVSDGDADNVDSDHHQHGGSDGHLEAGSDNVTLIGSVELSTVAGRPGTVSDVAVHNGFAYLGRFRYDDCDGPESGPRDGGVWVVDIRDPANPREVGFIDAHQDAYVGEGVQVLRIDTRSFVGDVLVVNNEACGDQYKAGVSLYDVTNPMRPRRLIENFGDFDTTAGPNTPHDANQIHSAFAWDTGDRAYVVMVDDDESADVDVMDITNPRKPVLIAEYDFNEDFPQIVDPVLGQSAGFLHDMVVVPEGNRWIMLASYWDSGYLMIDVTDPTDPFYVSDSDFSAQDPELFESTGLTEVDEGNAHQAELSLDHDFIIGADEDFNPNSGDLTNVDDGTPISGSAGSTTPPLGAGVVLEGNAVYVGRACDTDPAPPAATDPSQIAFVERGVCAFTEKIGNVEALGYAAAIVFNREGADACEGSLSMDVTGGLTTFGVALRSEAYAAFDIEAQYDLTACLAGDGTQTIPLALGTVGDVVRIRDYFDGWGYVRLFDNQAGKLELLDTYAIPEAHDPAYASGNGDLSVHEVAMSHVDNELGYLSYYAGGFRVIERQGDEIVEVGHYIAEGGNNFWGVQVFSYQGRELVAASDRDHGLYIFEYTP